MARDIETDEQREQAQARDRIPRHLIAAGVNPVIASGLADAAWRHGEDMCEWLANIEDRYDPLTVYEIWNRQYGVASPVVTFSTPTEPPVLLDTVLHGESDSIYIALHTPPHGTDESDTGKA